MVKNAKASYRKYKRIFAISFFFLVAYTDYEQETYLSKCIQSVTQLHVVVKIVQHAIEASEVDVDKQPEIWVRWQTRCLKALWERLHYDDWHDLIS